MSNSINPENLILQYLQEINKTSEVIPSDKTDDGVFYRIRVNNEHLCRIRISGNHVSICEIVNKPIDIEQKKKIVNMIEKYYHMNPDQFVFAVSQFII